MKIKQLLLSILGEKRYLFLLSNTFQVLCQMGFLGKEYDDILFLKRYIRKGDACLDIGAHLGYFTIELSRLTGPEGKVFAVEPMSKFNRVLERLLRKYKADNVTLYRVALGGNGDYVEMGIPEIGRAKKFAYARVMDSQPGLRYVDTERVENHQGDSLFGDLKRLDFLKIDVEGLEFSVLSSMMHTITTHRPILLCEFFEGEQRLKLYHLLEPLGYRAYRLDKDTWHEIDVFGEGDTITQNNYFIAAGQRERLGYLFTP